MGTETSFHQVVTIISYCNNVKLNNPLMGTETALPIAQEVANRIRNELN